MKKIFLFTAITFLMLNSCKKEATTLPQDETAAQSPLQKNESSSGGAFTFNDIKIIHYDNEPFYNLCTKEIVYLSGEFQFIVHGVYNGSKSTITVHANTKGMNGVSESERKYSVAATLNSQESNFSNGVFTAKMVQTVIYTTAGSNNNSIATYTFYIKTDADGNITYLREPVFETHCQ